MPPLHHDNDRTGGACKEKAKFSSERARYDTRQATDLNLLVRFLTIEILTAMSGCKKKQTQSAQAQNSLPHPVRVSPIQPIERFSSNNMDSVRLVVERRIVWRRKFDGERDTHSFEGLRVDGVDDSKRSKRPFPLWLCYYVRIMSQSGHNSLLDQQEYAVANRGKKIKNGSYRAT